MKKKFTHTERRGLPGGPNEYVTHISGLFSVEGYKSDSPDKDNPFNLIDSGNITMEGVEFPVMGIDNLGNTEMMLPQNNYEFPGDMVLEIPMAQDGTETPMPTQMLDEVVVTAPKKKESLFSKVGHGVLDGLGLIPGLGEIADGANALWYLAQGDKVNAGLSAAAMIPFFGWGATAGKLGLKGKKALDAANAARKLSKADLNYAKSLGLDVKDYNNLVDQYNAANKTYRSVSPQADVLNDINFREAAQKAGVDFTKTATDNTDLLKYMSTSIPYKKLGNVYTDAAVKGTNDARSFLFTSPNKEFTSFYAPDGYMAKMPLFTDDINKLSIPEITNRLKFGSRASEYPFDALLDNKYMQNTLKSGTRVSMPPASKIGVQENTVQFIGNRGERLFDPNTVEILPVREALKNPNFQKGREVPKRKGVRKNPDGSESTHLMATETFDGKNWFSFPTLFQNSDGTWIDMSDKPWQEAYEEAKKRGEVIEFGADKEAAIKFGEGSWKPKMQKGQETPPEKWQDTINYIDQQKLKRAIAQAESLNGELMKNPYSTASGLYGQRFSELEKGKLYEGTRDEFIKDIDAQNRIFDMRLNEGVKVNKTTPLLKDAFDLMNEYKPQIKDFDFDYYDIISLSNFLGRQGTREFFGNVIRDGKDLSEVFPNLYGPNVKQPNKTPEEYLGITRKYYRQYAGEIPVVAQDNTRVNMPVIPIIDRKPAPTSRYSDLLFTENDFDIIGDDKDEFNPFSTIPIDTLEVQRDNTNVVDTNILPDYLQKYEKLKGPDFSDEEFKNILFDVSQESEFNEYQDPVLIADFIKKSNYYAEGWKDMTSASPNEVKDLQDVLVRKGYDVGPTGVDGKYGPKTYAAHRAMVDDINLNPNSISRYYKKYGANNSSEVRGIQEKLVKLGYMAETLPNKNTTSIDGKFGDQTKEALERYNTENAKDDPKATVFNDIPNLLEEDRCAAGMCVILERNNVLTEAIGVKYKDAWDLYESMENADNSEMVYNIYDDPRFNRINEETDINDLRKITRNVKKESQTKASDYAIGDIVGLFWDGSSHHAETLKSKTYNTHSGFVSDIVDGVPIITHNVNGRVLQQPYDQLTTAWIRRPNEDVEVRSKYNETAVTEADGEVPNYNAINNLQLRYNTRFEGDRLNEVETIFKRAKYNSHKIPEILNSDVDQDWLESATVAITGVESGIGLNAPRTVEEARDDYFGLKGIAYDIKDKKESDISLGVGKTKFASLDKFAREYFDINSPKDLANDTKAVDAISYTLTKNYELFKDYAEQYPSLGLTEEDIKNMAVLAYNQGSNRLINTGRVDDTRTPEEEVEALRSLYNATLADRSSTNYRFLPEIVYDVALATGIEEESPSYINKVNTYINDLYPSQVADAGVNINNQPPRILAKGGEYGIYKNYIEGLYDGTDKIQFAEHIYDKLNRRHYKQAKNAAMAAPNFIMTNIIKNS